MVDDVIESTDFCKCGRCAWMPMKSERVCCKSKKFQVKMVESKCVTEHEDFLKIINKVMILLFKTIRIFSKKFSKTLLSWNLCPFSLS